MKRKPKPAIQRVAKIAGSKPCGDLPDRFSSVRGRLGANDDVFDAALGGIWSVPLVSHYWHRDRIDNDSEFLKNCRSLGDGYGTPTSRELASLVTAKRSGDGLFRSPVFGATAPKLWALEVISTARRPTPKSLTRVVVDFGSGTLTTGPTNPPPPTPTIRCFRRL